MKDTDFTFKGNHFVVEYDADYPCDCKKRIFIRSYHESCITITVSCDDIDRSVLISELFACEDNAVKIDKLIHDFIMIEFMGSEKRKVWRKQMIEELKLWQNRK